MADEDQPIVRWKWTAEEIEELKRRYEGSGCVVLDCNPPAVVHPSAVAFLEKWSTNAG